MSLHEGIKRLIVERTGAEGYRCHNAALAVYNFIRKWDAKRKPRAQSRRRKG